MTQALSLIYNHNAHLYFLTFLLLNLISYYNNPRHEKLLKVNYPCANVQEMHVMGVLSLSLFAVLVRLIFT